MMRIPLMKPRDDRPAGERCEVTLRDTFAAAALTGLLRPDDVHSEFGSTNYKLRACRMAYDWADAMLRERGNHSEKPNSSPNLDAAPAARGDARECAAPVTAGGTSVGVSATGAESGSTPDAQGFGRSNECPCQPFDSAPTTDQERFARFQSAVMNWISEATGFFHDDVLRTDDARDAITNACSRCWDAFDRIAYPTTNLDAAPTARADSRPLGNPVASAVTGSGETLSEGEIDAIQHVVEDGRLVELADYGCLRSLLVRLRPEWGDEESDRSKPISDERLDALEELSALDQELELKHGIKGNPMIKAQQRTQHPHATPPQGSVQGDGSVPCSRTENEPVAWAMSDQKPVCWGLLCPSGIVEIVTDTEQELRDYKKDNPDDAEIIIPLYRHPQPTLTDEEREAVETATAGGVGHEYARRAAALRKLLERLGGER